MSDYQVIIAGAGPVGLTLAIDLGLRGVRVLLLERNPVAGRLPKMERCNARTMEIFRHLGIVDRIRAAGYPAETPMDVFIITKMNQPPILHLKYPSVAEAKRIGRTVNDGSLPLEPYQLISQYTIEPLLRSIAESIPGVTVRFGCGVESFEQDATGVTVHVQRTDGGREAVRGQYLAGCDGGGSTVRKQLGIKLNGQGNLLELRQALFYAPDVYERIPIGKGRHYHVADQRNSGIVVQDSCKHFTLHAVVDSDEDMEKVFRAAVGFPCHVETLYVGKWTQHLLVADKYGEGRVFLAGDSAHLVIPTGGLGMNTGVGDAHDLAWMLAGTLQGWGGPGLLDSYLTERRQIGIRNVTGSGFAAGGRRTWRALWEPHIGDATPEGAALRQRMHDIADVEQRKTNEQLGTECGYRYIDTSLVCPEQGDAPDPNNHKYVPTSWPGARVPHVWLDDGTPLQDHLGRGYTLLRLGNQPADTTALEAAMRATGAPFEVLTIPDTQVRTVLERDLLLLRPDLHVVWRGDTPPAAPAQVAATVTGH